MTVKQLRFRPERCTRCLTCGQGCSTDTVSAQPVLGAAVACDLCFGDPACTVACPAGAFEWVDAAQATYWIGAPAANPLLAPAS